MKRQERGVKQRNMENYYKPTFGPRNVKQNEKYLIAFSNKEKLLNKGPNSTLTVVVLHAYKITKINK